MNITHIIPIRKHLAKVFFPVNKTRINLLKRFSNNVDKNEKKIIHRTEEYQYLAGVNIICTHVFYEFNGYSVYGKNIYQLWINNELYKRIKPSQCPEKLLAKYPSTKYTYLKFNLPIKKRLKRNKRFDYLETLDYNFWITSINKKIEELFWLMFAGRVFYSRKTTIDQEITDIFKEYDIKDSDYKRNSFKSTLYKFKEQVSI